MLPIAYDAVKYRFLPDHRVSSGVVRTLEDDTFGRHFVDVDIVHMPHTYMLNRWCEISSNWENGNGEMDTNKGDSPLLFSCP